MNSRAGDYRKSNVAEKKSLLPPVMQPQRMERGVQPLKTTGFPRLVSNEATSTIEI